ncbi:MAG TPA: hypothetical protein VHG72_18490 [Polyangia bacterium]|nr:hypothetical protein [Polyangia bacterium]
MLSLAVSTLPAMPSASVSCPGWPASCDGAWALTATDTPSDDDGPHEYATPVEVDCPTPPEPAGPVASGECIDAPVNVWFRVSRTADSERPSGGLAPAPRHARTDHAHAGSGPPDVGQLSAPDLRPCALVALPGIVPAVARSFFETGLQTLPARALAPPDRPPRA